jgi:hypothetical protein
MEEQIVDIEAAVVPEEEEQELSLEPPIKTREEARIDMERMKQLNRELKKIKRYMRSPIHMVRQMDAQQKIKDLPQ